MSLLQNQLPSKVGKRYRYRNTVFYAQDGLVRIQSLDDNTIRTISRRDALKRAEAFNLQLGLMPYGDERVLVERMVHNLIDCVREAKSQGDPLSRRDGDKVIHQRAQELTRQTRARIMPGDFDWEGLAKNGVKAGGSFESAGPPTSVLPNVPLTPHEVSPAWGPGSKEGVS